MKLVILLLALNSVAYANSTKCTNIAWVVQSRLEDLWQSVIKKPDNPCRDAIYSAKDYAQVYYQVFVRVPNRMDRTKGVYLELEDRSRWLKDVVNANQFYCAGQLQRAHEVYWLVASDLARCYGR